MHFIPLRPSVVYLAGRITPHLCIAGFLTGLSGLSLLFLAAACLFAALAAWHVLRFCAELYIITPEKIIITCGIFDRHVVWLEPWLIRGFESSQTPLMRSLGVTNFTLISDNQTNVRLHFKAVDMTEIRNALFELAETLERQRTNTVTDDGKFTRK